MYGESETPCAILVSRGQPVFCRFRFAVTAKRKRQKTGWPRETSAIPT